MADRTVGGLTAVRMSNSGAYTILERDDDGRPTLLEQVEGDETVAIDYDRTH